MNWEMLLDIVVWGAVIIVINLGLMAIGMSTLEYHQWDVVKLGMLTYICDKVRK